MSFALLHKLVAYLLSGLGLLALSLGSEMTAAALVLVLVGYVASFFAEGPILRRPGYARGWTAATALFLVVQVARAVVEGPTLAMAIEFAAALQISRLFNRREGTDYQQIAVLALLHLIAATVLSTSLSYGVIFIAFVVATPWMLALSHLRREIEGNYPASADGGEQGQAAIARVLASKRVAGPGFLVGTALLSVPLFAMTLTIFVMIPRVGKGFLSFERESGQRVAGFGNQVELGGFGVIRDDPTVVLRVTPLPQIEPKAPRVSLRMRGTSFDRYDGRIWTRSPSQAQRMRRPMARHGSGAHRYTLRRRVDEARDLEYQIVLDHLDEPVLFLPAGTVALEVPPRVVNGQAMTRPITRAPGLDIRYRDADGLGLVYTAYIGKRGGDADIRPILPGESDLAYLQVPQGHERVAALAREVVGSATGGLERARRIERYLKQGPFEYTLRQPEVGERIPLDVFLFEAKRGHCEYYSTAMAIMLRTLGVPTRNVTGFVGGRYNAIGGYYALRQGDAHSWVEVLVEGRGWVTFDPTPAARIAAGPERNLWADLSDLIDAVRTRWMTSVVGYDLETQRGIVATAFRWLSSHRSRSQDEADATSGPQVGELRRYAPAVAWLLLAVAAIAVALYLRRRRASQTMKRLPEHVAQVVSLYGDLERALRRRGHPRPDSATPLEHATALRSQGFAQSDEVSEVTRHYVEARYGERRLSPEELAAMRAMVKRVHDASDLSSRR